MGGAAVACCLYWMLSACPALLKGIGNFGGDPDIGKPYRQVLAGWRDNPNPPRRLPVAVVALQRGAGQTYTIPAQVSDTVTRVMWVDADGAYSRSDWYFRELVPVPLLHAGVLAEYKNFYA